MASTRVSAPIRGVTHQLGRLSGRMLLTDQKSQSTPSARSITTSTSTQATVSPIIISPTDYVPIKPFEERTVIATIHQFPSLEPLRFETYPANRLHLPTRKDILHRAVIYEGDKTRLGTASTKTRWEVRGSARKIRPQKGSGRARLGDRKSPMLVGGGVAFGPKPRDFSTKLQKKVYDLAWRTALSYRFRKGELIIVDNVMEIESPSTRLLHDILKHQEKFHGPGRSLLVTLEERPLLKRALAELDRAEQTATWEEVDVKDLLSFSRIIIERSALKNILNSHNEDLEHQELRPGSKRLVSSSPPTDHETTIGWSEFRDLQLHKAKLEEVKLKEAKEAHVPKSRRKPLGEEAKVELLETVLSSVYEAVASNRYAHAGTLPTNSPQRTAEMISSYRLLAEAKELQFKQTTGISLEECFPVPILTEANIVVPEDDTVPEPLSTLPYKKEDAEIDYPRLHALEYKYSKIREERDKVFQIDARDVKVVEINIQAIAVKVKMLEVQRKAAELAATALSYRAEAELLEGLEDNAQNSNALAGAELEQVALLKVEQMLEKANLTASVAEVKGQEKLRQEALKEVENLKKQVEMLKREIELKRLQREEGEQKKENRRRGRKFWDGRAIW